MNIEELRRKIKDLNYKIDEIRVKGSIEDQIILFDMLLALRDILQLQLRDILKDVNRELTL